MTKKNGFTLIELLVTTSLIVFLLLSISSLFMTFLLGNSKTNARKTVKQEGAYALGRMEFLIKNAIHVSETSPCTAGMTAIDIVSLDQGITTFETITETGSDKIASDSAALTSASVYIDPPLRFNCSGEVGNREIEIIFGLKKDTPGGTAEELFSSIIYMRN